MWIKYAFRIISGDFFKSNPISTLSLLLVNSDSRARKSSVSVSERLPIFGPRKKMIFRSLASEFNFSTVENSRLFLMKLSGLAIHFSNLKQAHHLLSD